MAEKGFSVSLSYEILPIISIPKEEYEELKKKAELADKIVLLICRSQRKLLKDIREITD